LGYYGMMAYRELKIDFPALSIDEKNPLELNLLPVTDIPATPKNTIEWLIAVDEDIFVEKILNEVVEDLKRKNITNEDTWLRVTSTYARAGLYLPLFSALGTLNPKVKDQLLNQHPDLLFPLAFASTIEKAAKQTGVPAPYIYSIIRQESAFNPEARSPVDAYGLMQLLPSLAKNLAAENKVNYKDADDLFDPEINIPLGAAELKNLTSRYKQQFILATAAYNANGAAIRGWLNNRFRPDPLEFIEEIPYEETRAYIKLVMRNYVFYQRLLNQNSKTPFPEKLLALEKPAEN
jgi:soluble lytic murein transglycosylase